MDVDTFINQTNGQHVDEDGYYGAQCWDLVAKYARVVVGCPSFPTGSGGAEGLYRLFQDPIPQYFDRIANDPNDPNQLPQKGDVMVWTAAFSPPYGHTALVVSADSSGPTVLEQNGNNPGGVAYIKKRNWVGVYGWLRPKKGTQDVITQDDVAPVRIVMSEVEGWNGNDIHSGKNDAQIMSAWVGQRWQDFIYHGWVVQGAHRQILVDKIATLTKQVSDANGTLITLQQQVADLGKRPTQEQLDALTKAIGDANVKAMAAQAELEKLQTQKATDTAAGDSFLRRLGQFIQKYL